MLIYCVYITTYKGNVLPPKYIGSSSIDRVQHGYRGSVSSRKWKTKWMQELLDHPELFETQIISKHETRVEALEEELRLQTLHKVVESTEWINEAYACPNGFFGRDVSGENNPNYGHGERIREWAKNNPQKASERSRKAANTQWSDPNKKAKRVAAMAYRAKPTRKTQTQEEFLASQRAKNAKAREKTLTHIEYNGMVYKGWQELLDQTGVTKHLYNKYYLKGINPLLRKNANGPIKGGSSNE